MNETAEREPLRIALVAHDGMKARLVEWAARNRETLSVHTLLATGTTGQRIGDELELEITRLKSGPLGGDAQLGVMIAEGSLDLLIFFTDPLSALPHDVDVKALLRLAVLHDVVIAMNAATADHILESATRAGKVKRNPIA